MLFPICLEGDLRHSSSSFSFLYLLALLSTLPTPTLTLPVPHPLSSSSLSNPLYPSISHIHSLFFLYTPTLSHSFLCHTHSTPLLLVPHPLSTSLYHTYFYPLLPLPRRFFLSHGADPDQIGGDLLASPLNWATRSGYLESVVVLIQAGADPLLKDKEGLNCVMVATAFEHTQCLAYILAKLGLFVRRAYYSKTSGKSLSPHVGFKVAT